MFSTADAVVIGAGVIGSGIGLELARSGRTVAIVDKGPAAGTGSTSASSANIRFHYSTREGVAAAWEAKHGWETWKQHVGAIDPAGMARYVQTGVLVLDTPGPQVHRTLALFDELSVPHERLTAQQVGERFPYLDNGQYYPPQPVDAPEFWDEAEGQLGAIYTPDGGFVDDPTLAAHNLFYAATEAGARGFFRSQVTEIHRDEGSVTGVTLDTGVHISTGVVVNAAGPHSAQVNEMASILDDFRIQTRPQRQEVHALPSVDAYTLGSLGPLVSDRDLGTYFRPQLGADILVGGAHPECDSPEWVDDVDSYNVRASKAVYEAQSLRFARRVPAAQIPSQWKGIAGIYDVSDDWVPIYDRTSLKGYYVAIGTSGNQFKNAPVVGAMMHAIIEMCERGRDHDADPIQWHAPYTDRQINLGHYSRLRNTNSRSSNSVVG